MADRKMLDLGCGASKRRGACGVDRIDFENVDVCHDLNQYPYPFNDNEFDDVLLDNSIEHLDDIVKVMEEMFRICRPGAKITIKVPYFRSHYAVDPTHKHFFASHSFYYFDPRHLFFKKYQYSSKVCISVDKIIFDEEYDYRSVGQWFLKMIKWVANKYPSKYEEYLASFFPLHSVAFYLTVVKQPEKKGN